MRYISSKENKIYKEVKKLLNYSYRVKSGLFLAEGVRITGDALKSGAAKYIVVSESYDGERTDALTYCLSDKLFSDISDTKSPQGIAAVCNMHVKSKEELRGNLLLICDGISDPGNLGTMIRTAECVGAGGVILLAGCADVYNPKTVRSTMGSIFRVPIYYMTAKQLAMLSDYEIIAATLDGSENLYCASFSEKVGIIIGSEAHGVSDEALRFAKRQIKIPMCGDASSLNAGVAAGIILYEIYRQIKAEGTCL